MASAIIASWKTLSTAVQRASCCSIAVTKASMRSTKDSACCAASTGPGGCGEVQAGRSSAHRRRTSAKVASQASSRGTKSGREGSPRRSSSTLSSNCAMCRSSRSRSPAARVCAMRQVCMRMRPASLTAAAPPSSCQVTERVSPIEASASTSSTPPMAPSLAVRVQGRFTGPVSRGSGWMMLPGRGRRQQGRTWHAARPGAASRPLPARQRRPRRVAISRPMTRRASSTTAPAAAG